MFKFLSIAVLGTAGLLSVASAAEACGGRCCPCPAAAAPTTPSAPPANAQAQTGTQVYRSYSYEPSNSYRSYSRSYRSPSRGEFDAGRKIRGL